MERATRNVRYRARLSREKITSTLLADGPQTIPQLAEKCDAGTPAVRAQVNLLRKYGLVARVRQGVFAHRHSPICLLPMVRNEVTPAHALLNRLLKDNPRFAGGSPLLSAGIPGMTGLSYQAVMRHLRELKRDGYLRQGKRVAEVRVSDALHEELYPRKTRVPDPFAD